MGAGLSFPDVAVCVSNADPNDAAAVDSYTNIANRTWRIRQAQRGRQYETQQSLPGRGNFEIRNVDEALNPANGSSSLLAYSKPFRRIRVMCMLPAGGTGNLLNSVNIPGVDGSFESYTNGQVLSWITTTGTVSPAVSNTGAFAGSNCLAWTVPGGSGGSQGVVIAGIKTIPGRTYTAQVQVKQSGAGTMRFQIRVAGSVVQQTTSTTTGSYVQLVLTFTATTTSADLLVHAAPTTVAETMSLDNVQVEPGGSAGAFTTSGPRIRGIWGGHVERFSNVVVPGTNGYEGALVMPCVGPLAALGSLPMHTELYEAIAAKLPTYYYPLWDGSKATYYTDVSGTGGPPLGPFFSSTGSATVTPGTATNIAGDPSGTGVQFSGQTFFVGASLDSHYSGQVNLPTALGSNAANWGVTVLAAFVCPDTTITTSGIGMPLAMFYDDVNFPFREIDLFFDANTNTGKLVFDISPLEGGDASVMSNTVFTNGTKMRLAIATVSQVGTTQTLSMYVDGVLENTTTVTTTVTYGVAAPDFRTNSLQLGGQVYTGDQQGANATIAHLAGWNRALSAGEITDLWNAFRGYPAEISGTRVARWLGLYYTGSTVVSAGRSPLSASPVTEEATLLASLQRETDSERGNLFETRDGIPAWESRDDRFTRLTSQATFGENFAGGQIPYTEAIQYDTDLQIAANQVAITQADGTKAVATADTTGSAKSYYPRPYKLTVDLQSGLEAVDRATWELLTRAQPKPRLAQLTVNVGANPALFGPILDLEIGQRYTVVRTARAANSGAGLTITGDFFLEYVNHRDVDPELGSWFVDLWFSPVPGIQPWILGDATYGQLGVTTVLGF